MRVLQYTMRVYHEDISCQYLFITRFRRDFIFFTQSIKKIKYSPFTFYDPIEIKVQSSVCFIKMYLLTDFYASVVLLEVVVQRPEACNFIKK